MRSLLRDEKSGICQRGLGRMGSVTTSSQISLLNTDDVCQHYFTATPDPSRSVFKPFVFLAEGTNFETPLSRCESADTPHALYSAHSECTWSDSVTQRLQQLEEHVIQQVAELLRDVTTNTNHLADVYNRSCEEELSILTELSKTVDK